MDCPIDWRPVGVRIVTDGHGNIALLDDDQSMLVEPVPLSDRTAVEQLTNWLLGYLTDTP